MPVTPDAGLEYVKQERDAGRDPFRVGQCRLDGRVICGGKGKRRQAPCLQPIICQNGRCRMHNGKALRGIAHPGYKHGRYSKYLPSRLIERYQQTVTDPEILNLTAEIALVDSRTADVLTRVDSGESGRRWRALSSARGEFIKAQRKDDKEAMGDAINDILLAIPQGKRDFEAWTEVVDLLERRRRLVESEQKRRMQMHSLVAVEEAYGSMEAIADAVKEAVIEHVAEPDARRLVLRDVQACISRYATGGVQQAVDGWD